MIVRKEVEPRKPSFEEMCAEFERQMDEQIAAREKFPIIGGVITKEVVDAMLERYTKDSGYNIIRNGESRDGYHFEVTNL